MSPADVVNEFPDTLGYFIPNALPLSIVELHPRVGDVSVIGECVAIEALIQTRAAGPQDVIAASRELAARQKQLLQRREVNRNLQGTPSLDVFQLCAL